ncbi:MAG: hypothetical protein MJK04_25155 [Psychrosphaera sp.]|nr:hypothetical protein [Psychrosphaera sp.]
MKPNFKRSIWVSYASAEQTLVDDLGSHIEALPANKDSRCQLYAYLRNADTSAPQESHANAAGDISWHAYLITSEPVQLVVESIATSLRRVLVLSQAYLKSEYCLWELCSCLIYSPNNMFVVMAGVDGFGDFKANDKLDYCLDAKTLVDALCKVYEARKESMHSCFHLPDDIEPAAFFSDKLDVVSKRVYLSTKIATTQVIGDEVLAYAQAFDSKIVVEKFWTFLQDCFDEWMANDSTKLLMESIAENEKPSFATLQQFNKRKLAAFVQATVNLHNKQSTPGLLSAMYQFSAILTLLRLEPEWVAEMRDANPRVRLLRVSVPQDYNHQTRAFYEASLAANAIQLVPVELIPGKAHIPKVVGTLDLTPPPEAITDTNDRSKRKDTLIAELVSLVMALQEDELAAFMNRPDWKIAFRAQIVNKHSDDYDLLTVARFYIDQNRFTQNATEQAVDIIKEIMDELNEGAAQNRRVNIGVIELLNKRDGDIVYSPNEDLLQAHVEDILRCQ